MCRLQRREFITLGLVSGVALSIGVPMARVTCPGIFPPDAIRVRPNLRTDNEANEIHGRTDHRHPGRA